MLNTIINVVLSVGCIVLGAKVIWNPVFYNKRLDRIVDLSGFNILLGCGLILFGIIFMYFQVTQKKKK